MTILRFIISDAMIYIDKIGKIKENFSAGDMFKNKVEISRFAN